MSKNEKSSLRDVVIYHFHIDGLKCQGCSGSIENILKENEAFITANCDHILKTLQVEACRKYHPDFIVQKISQLVEDAGFTCQYKQSANTQKKNLLSRWLRGGLGVLSGIALMISMMAGVSFSPFALMAIASIGTLTTLSLGWEFYLNAVQIFTRSREMNMNTLFTVSTLTILAVSIGSLFVPWLPMLFDAGLMIFGFRHLGIAIEESLKQSVVSNLKLTDYISSTVIVVNGQKKELVPLNELKVGQVINIKEGEVIPLDGICLSSDCQIYDTINTGARVPRLINIGERLVAGMFLAPGSTSLSMKVRRSPDKSYLAKFDKQIQEANKKPPLQTLTKTLLSYFIPLVLALSAVSFVLVGSFFPLAMAVQSAVSVLVSACPCTLGMIIPLSATIGMSKASRHGVYFKSVKALETFGSVSDEINHVVFDLHGTLTEGKPKVTQWGALTDCDEGDIFSWVWALEKKASHPVAEAINTYIKDDKRVTLKDYSTEALNLSNPAGRSAEINGQQFVIGNQKMMLDDNIALPKDSSRLKAGDSRVYLARERQVIAVFHLKDALRPDAKNVVNSLMRQGKTVSICTGADENTAKRYAKALGIQSIHAACRGENGDVNPKQSYIRSLKKKGLKVAMIGDGPNDAAALAEADASMVIVTGTDIGHQIAQEQAMAKINDDALRPVLYAFEVSQQTASNTKQSLLFSLIYNLLTLTVASGGLLMAGVMLNPAVGAGLMILQSSLILMNAYRFKMTPVDVRDLSQSLPRISSSSYTDTGLVPSQVKSPSKDTVTSFALFKSQDQTDYPKKTENEFSLDKTAGKQNQP